MIIQKITKSIARSVYNNIKVEDSKLLGVSVFERRLSVLMIFASLGITLVAVGIAFNVFFQLAITTAGLAMIRIVSGGNHFNSADLCYFVTTSAIIAVPVSHYLIPIKYDFYILVVCLIGYMIYAPHSWSSTFEYRVKKVILLSVIIVSYFFIREVLLIHLVLLADQIIGNQKYKNKRFWNGEK